MKRVSPASIVDVAQNPGSGLSVATSLGLSHIIEGVKWCNLQVPTDWLDDHSESLTRHASVFTASNASNTVTGLPMCEGRVSGFSGRHGGIITACLVRFGPLSRGFNFEVSTRLRKVHYCTVLCREVFFGANDSDRVCSAVQRREPMAHLMKVSCHPFRVALAIRLIPLVAVQLSWHPPPTHPPTTHPHHTGGPIHNRHFSDSR